MKNLWGKIRGNKFLSGFCVTAVMSFLLQGGLLAEEIMTQEEKTVMFEEGSSTQELVPFKMELRNSDRSVSLGDTQDQEVISSSSSQEAHRESKKKEPVALHPALTLLKPTSFEDAAGLPRKEDTLISLSLRNIDVVEALRFFSVRAGMNIVPTQKVSGRVTLAVENVPVKDVLDIMLRSNSLAYDKRGDIYNIMSEIEYKTLYGKNFSDTRKVKVFHLKYAVPEQAFQLLEALKSSIGRLLVESESGAVMIIDTPEKIAEAEKALEALEQQSVVKVFDLKYAKAEEMEETLKTQLDFKKVGTVTADIRSNQIVVQTLPERMKNIEEIINRLDKKTKGVLIDTRIIKIKLSNQADQGIQWEGLFNIGKQYGMTYLGSYPFSAVQATTDAWQSRSAVWDNLAGNVGSYPFSGTTSNYSGGGKYTPGEKLHVGVVGKKQDFDVMIKYLQTLGKSKILASPSLSIVNNQEAKLHIGERRAFVTTTTTTGSNSVTVAEEVTFVDVGVRLSLTPTIHDDGYITIKVAPEISSVVSTITTSSNNTVPILDTSTAETIVIAKDRSTIIIAGLGREEIAESSEQVPFLGRIPFFGAFFRNKSRTTEHVELVIMLMPIIYEGDKFISPKEIDKFPVKEKRSFDVFREEIPIEARSGTIPLSEQDDFSLKGVKGYSENMAAELPTEQVSQVFIPLNEGINAKGLKSYH